MDFIRDLGPLVLAHRFRRLTESLLRSAETVYDGLGLRFRPRWTSTYLLMERDGPLTVTEIAQALRLTHPGVIGITAEMREAGLITEVRGGGDARRRLLALTPAARRLKPTLRRAWKALAEAQEKRFSEAGCDIMPVLDAVEDGIARQSLASEVVERVRGRGQGLGARG